MPPFKKGEKITDQAILDRLAAARAKALEVRQAKKKAKDDEKLVADLEQKKQAAEVQQKLDSLTKKKSLSKPEIEKNESESEPEEEIVVVKKKPKKPKKRKVVYVQDSEPESEVDNQEDYRTPNPKATVPEPPEMDPREAHLEQLYQATYGRKRLRN